jgi:hypothetical protein
VEPRVPGGGRGSSSLGGLGANEADVDDIQMRETRKIMRGKYEEVDGGSSLCKAWIISRKK